MLVVRAALAGKSLPASQCVLAAPACHMPAGAASRYALGADGVGAARPAPAANPISASRTRSAHGAPRRGRCAPVCRAAQPLAAIAASRYALGADDVGAARPGACGSQVAASRYALGAEGVGAARPGAYMLPPRPPLMRALPLGGGDVEDVVRFTLLETLLARRASRSCRGRGWGGVVQTSSCASVRGNACVLPQHVQCASARSAAGIGAPSPQARPIPRAFSARAPALRAGAVRTGRRCAPAPFSREVNNTRPSRVPPR